MRRYAAALTLALMLTAPIAKPVVAEGERAGAFDPTFPKWPAV